MRAAIAFAIVLVGGYTAYWFIMAQEFDRAIDDWVGASAKSASPSNLNAPR